MDRGVFFVALLCLVLACAVVAIPTAPKSNAFFQSDYSVDLVYTWVNGSEQSWRDKRMKDQRSSDITITTADSNEEHRFQDHNELQYSLRSVAENAKWIRKIFIVTCCGQRPSWLKETDDVEIVDHSKIIPRDLIKLPTYNSFAIESWVHNIPGLAEHFLLMNDDFFFSGETHKNDFFEASGAPKIAFQEDWGYTKAPDASRDMAYLWAAYNCDVLLNNKFMDEKRYKILHQAYPATKSLFEAAHNLFGEQLNITTSHKFRTRTDVIPLFLASWVGIYQGKAIKLSSSEYPSNVYIRLEDSRPNNRERLLKVLAHSGEYKVMCIGDHQRYVDGQDSGNLLDDFFAAYFPKKSPWEL
eukprot:c12377_g1_i1.p1 GENE.c12377_g1_i1~~c12377_g1_i1.p1  ORF type:complete len:368 (-),score=83.42 c12377_g1_i1:214-1281(-)